VDDSPNSLHDPWPSPEVNPLADEFLKRSVFFETKVLVHLDNGVPLDRSKVLVMPAG
jgi:hypothetical protein